MIPRLLQNIIIEKLLNSNKAIVIYGARQVGKTTLSNEIILKSNLKTLFINGDQLKYIEILSSLDLNKYKALVENYNLIFIDEAQRIPEIGIAIKIMVDNFPKLKILVTGSSSLDLASKVSEPLTGRILSYRLYPISFKELNQIHNKFELNDLLEERLIFGSYPEVISMLNINEKVEYLRNLTEGYLYKDLLDFGEIKNSSKIRDLLKLLAFQIGSQVSLSELGNSLGMSKDTVSRYIDLLEKSYVIFRLKGFNRNLRKEVTKMDKVYFFDLGIRNSLIDNFKTIKDRNDVGAMWENFLITERLKYLSHSHDYASIYFWRLYTGAELDFVEEKHGDIFGYEFKLGSKIAKAPNSWTVTYPNSSYKYINRENYLDFII